eukprot:3864404-Rhodomonas_salina.1
MAMVSMTIFQGRVKRQRICPTRKGNTRGSSSVGMRPYSIALCHSTVRELSTALAIGPTLLQYRTRHRA